MSDFIFFEQVPVSYKGYYPSFTVKFQHLTEQEKAIIIEHLEKSKKNWIKLIAKYCFYRQSKIIHFS
jgi:hypothetical protein